MLTPLICYLPVTITDLSTSSVSYLPLTVHGWNILLPSHADES